MQYINIINTSIQSINLNSATTFRSTTTPTHILLFRAMQTKSLTETQTGVDALNRVLHILMSCLTRYTLFANKLQAVQVEFIQLV